jgi:four helix bundle protein
MQEVLKARTKRFAIDVFRFSEGLPDHPQCWVIGRQLMRSGSSVGANYRAACRAQSRAAFVAKMAIVEEEADETAFWLEVVEDLGHASVQAVRPLLREARELTAIAASSKKTARRRG